VTVYENTYVMPSHLARDFVQTMPLPNNPSYLSIKRPGNTSDAYFFSSAEILSGTNLSIEINYRLFDPDGTRDMELAGSDLEGDEILTTTFEFSLNGGGVWQTASPVTGEPSPVLTATRQGYPATFLWDAGKDRAISDNARFRITLVQQNRNGPFQRASISAVSPPFRVRSVTCEWPAGPSITVDPDPPQHGDSATFTAHRDAGGGQLTYIWNFGDGTSIQKRKQSTIDHTFTNPGTYNVRMTIQGALCPICKEVFTIESITVE